MTIDFHCHHPAEAGFAQKLVDLMPQARIDRVCLCSAGPGFGHASNAEILRAAQKYPSRLTAFAHIELGKDTASTVAEYAGQGFAGFKITNPRGPYDSEAFFPVYEQMEHSGLPLLAHTGILMRFNAPAGMVVNSDWMRPIRLDAVLRSFPKLNIVGAHMGAPWHEEASMLCRMHPNFYLDLTGAYWGGWRVNKTPEFFRYHFFWKDAWNKIVFGTDILALNEFVPSREYHDGMIAGLGLPEETVNNIYGGTAARLLKLKE